MTVIDRIRVLEVRGQAVVLDSDLAAIYGVETKQFNRAVRRNAARFPGDFAFQVKHQELASLRCQIGTSSLHGGRSYIPWVFTEPGAIMAATILNSPRAVAMSVYVVLASGGVPVYDFGPTGSKDKGGRDDQDRHGGAR